MLNVEITMAPKKHSTARETLESSPLKPNPMPYYTPQARTLTKQSRHPKPYQSPWILIRITAERHLPT